MADQSVDGTITPVGDVTEILIEADNPGGQINPFGSVVYQTDFVANEDQLFGVITPVGSLGGVVGGNCDPVDYTCVNEPVTEYDCFDICDNVIGDQPNVLNLSGLIIPAGALVDQTIPNMFSGVITPTGAFSQTNDGLPQFDIWLMADRDVTYNPTTKVISGLWLDQAVPPSQDGSTMGQPTIELNAVNGLPCVRILGDVTGFQFANSARNGWLESHLFIALKMDAETQTGSFAGFMNMGSSGTVNSYASFFAQCDLDYGSAIAAHFASPGGLSSWHVLEIRNGVDYWSYWKNGVKLFERLSNSVSFPFGGGGDFGYSIGTHAGAWRLVEWIEVSHVLTDAEATRVVDYLKSRLGI